MTFAMKSGGSFNTDKIRGQLGDADSTDFDIL
jgi:hypothetical protein